MQTDTAKAKQNKKTAKIRYAQIILLSASNAPTMDLNSIHLYREQTMQINIILIFIIRNWCGSLSVCVCVGDRQSWFDIFHIIVHVAEAMRFQQNLNEKLNINIKCINLFYSFIMTWLCNIAQCTICISIINMSVSNRSNYFSQLARFWIFGRNLFDDSRCSNITLFAKRLHRCYVCPLCSRWMDKKWNQTVGRHIRLPNDRNIFCRNNCINENTDGMHEITR